jgi:hypothetical protein
MSTTSSPRSRSGGRDVHHVEAVVEVLAERALLDLLLEVAVRRRDHADVDALGLGVAHLGDHALLQRAQELHLQRDGQLADLVEEERALVRRWNLPSASRSRR